MDYFSLISNIFSIVISVVAFILSIYFFNHSLKTNKESEKIASDIKNSVSKLEDLFNKLYSDTFSMLKDQNNLMQQHFIKTSTSLSNSNIETKLEPNQIVISKIVEHRKLTVETLQKQCTTINNEQLIAIVKELQNKGSIDFDGDLICFKMPDNRNTAQS